MAVTDKLFLIPERLARWRAAEAEAGRTVGVLAGSFDLLQPGNLTALRWATQMADSVCVILEPDELVDSHADPERPRHSLAERAEFVSHLREVDAVTSSSVADAGALLESLSPYTWVFCPGQSDDPFREKGMDLAEQQRPLRSLPGCSTDDVVNAIRVGHTPILLPDAFYAESRPASSVRETGTTVTVNGCFDVLHIGHLRFLFGARSRGDRLIVLVNDDESVRKYKGDDRPVFPLNFRTSALSSLESVSGVRAFRDDNPLRALEEIQPDIHVKGGSFIPDRADDERQLVESWGGKLVFTAMEEGYSSTGFISGARKS